MADRDRLLRALAAAVGLLDLVALPTGTRVFRIGLVHMTLNLAITGGFIAGFLWRRAIGAQVSPVPWGPLVLSLACLALLSVSGFLGGKLAFRYGVRVADEGAQVEGYQSQSTKGRTSWEGGR